MSFSPTGKIASSRRKISGENDGQLMVPAFSDYQLSVKRKCGISILNANNWSVCLRNFLEILTRMTTTHSWCKMFFSCAREHHLSLKFELAPSNERTRIAHCFFLGCRTQSTTHRLASLSRLIFSPTHHSRRFGLQPELFGSRKLAFSDPT